MQRRIFHTFLTISFVCLASGWANAAPQTAEPKNEVIVMGMIHSGHNQHEVFGIERLKSMIKSIQPDYVLTEIPPDRLKQATRDFQQTGKISEPRVRVFPEYTEALFPLTKEMNFKIIPCAAWTEEMNNSRRKKLAELKVSHAQQYEEMETAQGRASEKIAQLGNSRDPKVIHTEAYDDCVREGMGPYDKHFNNLIGPGGWSNINAGHYGLIEKALNEHTGEGKRILITFGSWHKYYIKEQLKKRTDISLIPLTKFLKADRPGKSRVASLLRSFSNEWDETKWEQDFRRLKYMRSEGDDGWKQRFACLQSLVRLGAQAVPDLTSALKSEHTPSRILVAHALSYLAPHVDIDVMSQHYKTEKDAAVRLYLVDAIGMSGKATNVDWDSLASEERNRDVLKHIGYAKDRGSQAIDAGILETLANWNTDEIDTAKVGKLAPDFTLRSVEGKPISLKDYRGKPMVLVFVYGDT